MGAGLRNLLARAHGAAEPPVKTSRKNEKRHNRKLPHGKEESVYPAFAIRHQFQGMRRNHGKPVVAEAAMNNAATPAKMLFKRIIGSDSGSNYQNCS